MREALPCAPKATAELLSRGVAPDAANRQLQNLWNHLEQLL